MSARRKSLHGRKALKGGEKNNELGMEVASKGLSPQELEEMREKWVQDRRAELDKVFDVHDSLVRGILPQFKLS